ncbi:MULTISPECIES: hypothetical protein [unclassified Bacillus (in: firmicutes)]|uniref:hypothetical protein n=1 Tax=unclassified Bacillus (in: firmicutes) TaxID=185979 RepID=UPI002035E780|nr:MULTISPECIES: hypothetical protein [unclassified Bacillus (in: firmicutes)]
MKEELNTFFRIFTTTREAIEKFINMLDLDPVIQHSNDEHERLLSSYYRRGRTVVITFS